MWDISVFIAIEICCSQILSAYRAREYTCVYMYLWVCVCLSIYLCRYLSLIICPSIYSSHIFTQILPIVILNHRVHSIILLSIFVTLFSNIEKPDPIIIHIFTYLVNPPSVTNLLSLLLVLPLHACPL